VCKLFYSLCSFVIKLPAIEQKFIMILTSDLRICERGHNSSLLRNNTLWRLCLWGDGKRKNFIIWNQETQLNWNEEEEKFLTLFLPTCCQSLFLSLFSFFPVALTLEHTASVKRFVSLQFLNRKTVGRSSWTGDQPVARPLPAHRTA
jgi:hypothetical protein